MARAIGVSLTVLMATVALGQSSESGRTFDVASIRPHDGPLSRMDITTAGPRFTAMGESVPMLIVYAYDLKSYELASNSALSASYNVWYDILEEANSDATPTKAEFRQMLQGLLADRFKLVVHHEKREMPVYALVVGKDGPKFKESAPGASDLGFGGVDGRNQSITKPKATMDWLAENLSIYADRPIVNKTGLSGTYEIKLQATPWRGISRDPQEGDISVFDAVQVQLGLKLVKEKDMVDVLVVDHVEKPSEN
jgi:uncharacterized protein (TIGR03435 family)